MSFAGKADFEQRGSVLKCILSKLHGKNKISEKDFIDTSKACSLDTNKQTMIQLKFPRRGQISSPLLWLFFAMCVCFCVEICMEES